MDFLALYITSRLTHSKISPFFIAAGALIGAVWALIVTLLEPYTKAFVWQIVIFAANIACGGVMTAVASRQKSISLKNTAAFVAVNMGLGGIMTAIYSVIGKAELPIENVQSSTVAESSPLIFIISAIIAGAVSLTYGRFRAKSAGQIRKKAELSAFDKCCPLTLLCDSGNLLHDPYTGKPVVIICAKSLCDILPQIILDTAFFPDGITDLPYNIARKVRLIPASGVTGNSLLLCFIPDKLTIDGIELDAAMAIDTNSTDYDGCDGIIPQILLNI